MVIMRAFCLLIGLPGLAMGLLWVIQGLGLIAWPTASFMIGNRIWALYGAILTVFSATVIILSRRR